VLDYCPGLPAGHLRVVGRGLASASHQHVALLGARLGRVPGTPSIALGLGLVVWVLLVRVHAFFYLKYRKKMFLDGLNVFSV
jgi:hypothetical protein